MKPEQKRVIEMMPEGLFCTVLIGLLEKVTVGAVVYDVCGPSH